MRMIVEQSDGVTVATFDGELDLGVADQLRQALLGLVAAGTRRLVVDLAGVPRVDSSALSALVAVAKRLRELGGGLRLCALQAPVAGVLALTRLGLVLEVHPDRRAALASWDGGAAQPPR